MYIELKPKSWLRRYIDAYWLFQNEKDETIERIIIPDGSTDIIIPFQVPSFKPWVVGCMTYGHQVTIPPKQRLLGIRFNPGCALAFLCVPIYQIQNIRTSLDSLHTFHLSSPQQEMQDYMVQNYIEQLELELQEYFLEENIDPLVLHAITQIKKYRGIISIDFVSNDIGISRRQLERKFKETVGLSPKMLARIIRFQGVYKQLKQNEIKDLSTLAFNAGYYDQAHFNKEFKLFTGATPTKNSSSLIIPKFQ